MNDLAKHIAEGVTAKLNFDFACNRGHAFGEYHVHGVINEILCARTDPTSERVIGGYDFPEIQQNGKGRKKEIDLVVCEFAVDCIRKNGENKGGVPKIAIEVKWAGSSHCSDGNILKDLMRLQWVANSYADVDCLFVLAGSREKVEDIFKSKKSLLKEGTNSLLSRTMKKNSAQNNVQNFYIDANKYHREKIGKIKESLVQKGDWFPALETISAKLISADKSAPSNGRFFTYVWRLQSQRTSAF